MRNTGRGYDGPRAETSRVQKHRGQAPACLCRLVLIHELIDSRNLGQPVIALAARLYQHANELFFAPAMKRLAPEEHRERSRVALNLALFDGQVDLASSRIAADDSEL